MLYSRLFIAAHCLKSSVQTISPDVLIASFGKYPLNRNDTGSKDREIASYTLHPDYNDRSISGDSDLAILTLKTPIEFSRKIKPICMWYGSIDLQSVVNMVGYVIWKEAFFTQESLMMKAPIVSQVKLSLFR